METERGIRWLSQVHSQVLQQCLKDLDRAYTNCFAGRTAPPQSRKKFLCDSFRYPQGFKVDGRLVYLPTVGWCEFWHSRDLDGTVKNVTISRQGQHWFVAFQVELDVPDPVHPATAHVGIDLGIATFAAFSDGALHPPLNAYRTHAAKEARMQRRLAGIVKYRRTGRSSNAALPGSISASPIAATPSCASSVPSQQKSRGHQHLELAGTQHVAVARGTVEEPGHNVAAKSGLNKAILDQGWGTFRRMLEYKQLWRGGA